MNKTVSSVVGAGFLALLVGCGDSSSGSDGAVADSPEQVTQLLDELSVVVNGVAGDRVDGTLPFTDGGVSPHAVSVPTHIDAAVLSSERVDIVFETASALEEVYLTLDGATAYLAFPVDSVLVGTADAVSVSLDLSSSFSPGEYCLSISVRDRSEQLSDVTSLCLDVTSGASEDREVVLASASANSVISIFNLDTGNVEEIGASGFALTDVAWLNGELYGVTFSELVRIDADTGDAASIGSVGVFGVNALAGAGGTLYGATLAGELLSINPDTGTGTVIGTLSNGAYSSGDLAFDDASGMLFGTVVLPGTLTDAVVSIDPSTGESTVLGTSGISAIYGLAVARGQLFGFTNSGEYILIDTATGAAVVLEQRDAYRAFGVAGGA